MVTLGGMQVLQTIPTKPTKHFLGGKTKQQFARRWNRTKYTYDEMDRLETHTGPDGSWEYGYDLNGNRDWHKQDGVQSTYGYNASKTRLTAIAGGETESRAYDANGNTTQIDNRFFDYNDLNRLWRYREGSLTVTYKHNAFGERQIKQNGSTTTRFLYAGPNLMHEQVGNTNRDYVYLDGKIVGMVTNGVLYYVHNDHLGRPEVVTDSAKSVVWDSQNNAFDSAPGIDLIGNFNVGFPGQYYDIESGMYYNYFRTYDGTKGRYLQTDPIGLLGGLNTYSYVGANPLSYTDALGLDAELWENSVYPPTQNCSFVDDCVAAERQLAHDINIPIAKTPLGVALKKAAEIVLIENEILARCERDNACQCAGTCPDKPPTHEPPETESEKARRERKSRFEFNVFMKQVEEDRAADAACRRPEPRGPFDGLPKRGPVIGPIPSGG